MSEQSQPPKEAAFFASIRSWGLVRGTSGVVGGVVEGVGNRIGLARVPARLLVVVAWLLLPGLVMLAYAAGWALLPDHRGNIIIQNFGRGVTNVGALIGIAVLTLLGLVGFDNGPVFRVVFGSGNFYLWDDFVGNGFLPRVAVILIPLFFVLAIVTGLVVLLVWLAKRANSNTADAPVTPTPPAGSAPSNGPQGSGAPQPWEPALLPGDSRAGVAASSGATQARANAAHAAGAPHAASGQTGPASASAATAPPAPRQPAQPPRPPAPTVPGPGQGAYLAFVAVLLLAAAATVLMAREDMLAVSPLLAWGAAITVGLGAILFIVALAGRKLGFLGFLSVFAVLLAVLFSGNAEQIRDSYTDHEYWFTTNPEIIFDEEVTVEEYDDEVDDAFDLTTELASSYSAVFVDGQCMSPSHEMTWDDARHQGASMASMRLDTVEDDMDIDLAATFTRLAIPAGTSLEVVGTGANNLVVWEERDASCASWNYDYEFEEYDEYGEPVETEPRPLLSATNPDAPVLTINAGADKSIYIEEVAK